MKMNQTWCKDCVHYYYGDCRLLLSNMTKTKHPCGKVTCNFPLMKEVKKLGVRIFTKQITRVVDMGCYTDHISNFIDSCTLNKGNCKYYKRLWYKFWIERK